MFTRASITICGDGRNEGASLVHQLAGNLGALPPDVVDEIVERTNGVPLFVEELTKAVVEAGTDRGYGSISAVPSSSLAVPATLHASLLKRPRRCIGLTSIANPPFTILR
jgi:predicted ATPase